MLPMSSAAWHQSNLLRSTPWAGGLDLTPADGSTQQSIDSAFSQVSP